LNLISFWGLADWPHVWAAIQIIVEYNTVHSRMDSRTCWFRLYSR